MDYRMENYHTADKKAHFDAIAFWSDYKKKNPQMAELADRCISNSRAKLGWSKRFKANGISVKITCKAVDHD